MFRVKFPIWTFTGLESEVDRLRCLGDGDLEPADRGDDLRRFAPCRGEERLRGLRDRFFGLGERFLGLLARLRGGDLRAGERRLTGDRSPPSSLVSRLAIRGGGRFTGAFFSSGFSISRCNLIFSISASLVSPLFLGPAPSLSELSASRS